MASQRWRVGLGVGAAVAGIVLLLWLGNFFTQLRLQMSNVYFIPTPISDRIAIIALDDASLARYGRSPVQWSRSVYVDLIETVSSAGARVMAFDILFAEASPDDALVSEALVQARASAARTRFVMPAVGTQALQTRSPEILFHSALTPVFQNSVDYVGFVNVYTDSDGLIRRQPSLIRVEETPSLTFSLATYLAYLRIPPQGVEQVVRSSPGRLQVTPERTLSVDGRGQWMIHYFGPPRTFPVYSLVDVLSGAVDTSVFQDKIVLVGMINTVGLTDRYSVPVSAGGEPMAGVEIQANAIESLLQNMLPVEASPTVQAALIVVLSLVASVIYAHLRWQWMLPVALVLIGAWAIFAFVYFELRLEMMNLFHGMLSLALPVIPHMGIKITAERARRQQAELLLESLNAVSRERLTLDNVLPRVAEDFQRVLDTPVGGIWLADGMLAYGWPDTAAALALESTCQQTLAENRLLLEAGLIALPIAWRGRTLAVCVMRSRVPLRKLPLRSLLTMAEELAPVLDNAILYTETVRQNALLEAILSGSPIGILVTDERLHVVRANRAVDEALGVSAADYLGKSLAALLADARIKPDMQTRLLHRLEEGDEFQDELRLDGSTFNADAAPLARGGWVIMINDVSMLAELNRIKTQMMRIAAHDLRNPLGLVLNYGELILMKQDEITPENRRFVENMVGAGQEMLRVIDNILNVEQLPFGKHDRQ